MLDLLRTYHTVVKTLNLTEAGNVLRLSKAMISRRIDKLECELGVKLLHRNTRSVRLTEAGEKFYSETLELRAQWDHIVDNIQQRAHQVRGVIKVGVPASIGLSLALSDALPNFMRQYPELDINFMQGDHLPSLRQENFDAVIHCNPLIERGDYYTVLPEWRKVVCASPAYLKEMGVPKCIKDLSAHRCIDHYYNYQRTWRFVIDGRSEFIPIETHLKTDSSLHLAALAENGCGLAYLPSFVVAKALKAKRLVSVLDVYSPGDLPMYIVYQQPLSENKKMRVFIEFLKDFIIGSV